ncbi:MAG TPA: radical SAM protein [Candidatus Binataceae bacterium]|nr:radical SAM protein [Candidatus Binataceae bacterium]
MTKVTLVRPPPLVSTGTLQAPITPPLGVAYLAANLRAAGHQVTIVDALGEAPSQRTPCFDGSVIAMGLTIDEIVSRIPADPDVIGISCMFSQDWPHVRKIAEAIRRAFPRSLIAAGGEHISALPIFTLETCPEIDLCVIGEGEETIVEVANCVTTCAEPSAEGRLSPAGRLGVGLGQIKGIAIRSDGKPTLTPPRARVRDIDAIPRPAWDLTPIDNYLDNDLGYGINLGRSMPILATRGCPYQCTFCSSPTMWTTRWTARDPAAVLDEIQDYMERYHATNIDFYDLTAIVRKDWILAFCDLIEQRGMKFTWQLPSGTRSEALDAEACRALYRAGCRNVAYAPESGSPAVLKRIKKRVNLDKMMDSMRSAEREGISLKANIVIGFPDETRLEALQTIAFMARTALAGVHDVLISVFSPYPGSELFDQMRARGDLPKLDEKYFLSLATFTDLRNVVSRSQHLSSREIAMLRIFGYLAFYGAQYARRPWRLWRTLHNFAVNRQESRGDKTLHEFLQRRTTAKMAGVTQ